MTCIGLSFVCKSASPATTLIALNILQVLHALSSDTQTPSGKHLVVAPPTCGWSVKLMNTLLDRRRAMASRKYHKSARKVV